MTDAELDVWRFVEALNRTWTSGHPEQLADYFHERMVAITPNDRSRLEGRDACVAAWTAFVRTARMVCFTERDPDVRIFGDAAVVTYDYEATVEIGGRVEHLAGRDMFCLVQEGGRWWAVADQFSAVPGASPA